VGRQQPGQQGPQHRAIIAASITGKQTQQPTG